MHPVVYPSDWLFRSDPPPLEQFGRRLLAEGDSWFTLGSLQLTDGSNLLNELQFARSTAVVNCAYPGDTLQQVIDHVNDPYFDRLLRHPRYAGYWEAVVLSAGGNDLFEAAGHGPTYPDGTAAALQDRLLLTPAEAAAENPGVVGADRYVSRPGWSRFETYLKANLADLVTRRDQGPSRGRPIFVHTYVPPVVRHIDATGSSKVWVAHALQKYGIGAAEHQAVLDALFVRLRGALMSIDSAAGTAEAMPQFHVFDAAASVSLDPADPAEAGNSGDWINEIHPNRHGYAKLGAAMGPWMDAKLALYP